MTNSQIRNDVFSKRLPGRVRRNDRRAVIARKNAFLIEGLTTRH